MGDVEKNNLPGRWAKYLMVSYTIRRASYIIRALAGIYLVYLMYQLFSEAGKSEEELSVFMIAVAVLMMAAGVYFAVGGGYALLKGIYAENEPVDEPEAMQVAVSADEPEAMQVAVSADGTVAAPEEDSGNDDEEGEAEREM